jgi:hypothetical protein
MGGGPTQLQKDAASRDAALATKEGQVADQRNAREQEQYNLIKPYATSRLQNGLPFMNAMNDYAGGSTARAFAPARANLMRRTSMYGSALPSGFQQGALSDLDSQQAHAYDQNLMQNMLTNEQAKSEAARLLTNQQQIANPLGFYGAAGTTNQNIMNSPLQSPGLLGLLGGAIGGAAGGAKGGLPF